MANYELLYIIPAQYTEEELAPIQDSVREQILKGGGKIFFEDNLGKKKLSYPIQKTSQGYYILAEFVLGPDKLQPLNTNLKLTDKIIRHIIVKKKERSEKQIERATRQFVAAAMPSLTEVKEREQKLKLMEKEGKEKIKLEDLDKKLDELMDADIL